MLNFSLNEAARKLGLYPGTLARYVVSGKVPPPKIVITGKTTTHIWSEADIERVRQLLPKIADGRKTRHIKKHLALSNQQSGKTKSKAKKQPQARVPVPHNPKEK